MAENNFKTIGQFFSEAKRFVIPNYQRGYKWGVPDKAPADKEDGKGKATNAVEVLMNDLVKAFDQGKKSYFLQGITVSEQNQETILIDGQQRTTTLFLLLNQLGVKDDYLVKNGALKLRYDVRPDTQLFLEKLFLPEIIDSSATLDENVQDIHYLKKANESIKVSLRSIELSKFAQFVLNNVLVLYIKIDHDKATKTFTMMNGQKATMKAEELIKAELLRLVSVAKVETMAKPTSLENVMHSLRETVAVEWDINALRSKYAREWDKWLYWWNREEVAGFYKTGGKPMGLLLEYFYLLNETKASDTNQNQEGKFAFDTFKFRFLNGESTIAKSTFADLRKLQKTFEDLFNHHQSYNSLGVILNIREGEDRKKALSYLISNFKNGSSSTSSNTNLVEYARWALVGASHDQIINDESAKTSKEEKAAKALKMLSSKYVYADENDEETDLGDVKEYAYQQLLWLNIKEDNRIGRKFDFSIWKKNNRSLEHIHPKSKRAALDFNLYPTTDIHCIGNLVLLYGANNSEFGAKDVPEKKRVFFDVATEFKSRHLLHTISVFSTDTWDEKQIYQNQKKFISLFKTEYGIKD